MSADRKVSRDTNDTKVIKETNILDLPFDLINLIASRLKFADRIRFRTVCKSWYLNLAPISVLEQGEMPWPVLAYLPNDCEDKCKIFDPIIGKIDEYEFEIPTYGRVTIFSASNGWMIIADEDDDDICISIINIFSPEEDVVDLPFVADIYRFKSICSSSPPTNSNCVVVGISGGVMDDTTLDIYLWRHGQESWSQREYENDIPFICGNSMVFHKDLFYCLGRNGNIGIFDPTAEKWTVLAKPKPIYQMKKTKMDDFLMSHIARFDRDECCYLVESFKGHLLSVFDYKNGKPLLVMRLDESKMAWTKLEELEDEILFLDERSSVSIPAPSKRLENRIYFTRFLSDGGERNEGVYYSLKSKKYHSNPDYELREKVQRAWVMRIN